MEALMRLTLRSLSLSVSILSLALPVAAQAQTEAPPEPANAPQDATGETLAAPQETSSADTGEPITVTGSRIRRPNLESTVPVTSVGGEEFFQTGQVSV